MQNPLLIYIDRLKEGRQESINETVPSSLIGVQEDALSFPTPVSIKGSAYLATDHLVLELSLETTARLPCIVCNEKFDIPIQIAHLRHTIPLTEISSAVYDFLEDVREALLLQVPEFFECQQGHCPERITLSRYLKQPEG